ncbi:class I SAM-dependent methyltransferase [beta proteobacterium MWH-UniP1]
MPEPQKSLANPFLHWDAWSQTPLGKKLLAEEQAWLDATLQDVFGYHAAQISPEPLDALRTNRMSCRAKMVWPKAGAAHQVESPVPCEPELSQQCCFVGSTHDLPFATESLDLLVLAHTLEVTQDPHHLLREAHRVLIPEGKLVITGFNPWSLWRLRKSCRSVNLFPPAGHQWFSLPRLKDWLSLLNFDLGAGGASAYGAYVPPLDSDKWLDRMRWMDPAGRRWWPMAGGTYFLMSVKRVHHIRLIGPNWRDRKALAGRRAAAAPSVRISQQRGADV